MAFQNNSATDFQNPQRKILQELNLKKKLLKSGTAQTLNPSLLNTPIGIPTLNQPQQDGQMAGVTRTPLQVANATSFSYFITQDSNFGNQIMAVLPRYSDAK